MARNMYTIHSVTPVWAQIYVKDLYGNCGLCGRKATLEEEELSLVRPQELCERRGGRPGLHVHNSPYVDAKQH